MIFLFLFIIISAGRRREQLCFPKGFKFGVATASFQVEGAWNVSGKGESIWDRYTHEHPERVFDHSNADVAADSYHNFRRDVDLVTELSLSFYRFSVSWPRVLPTGYSNLVNEDGLRYYSELLDTLHKNNIKPVVTIYHWDLPQSLQDLGGWTNPIIVDYFVDYARLLFTTFGDRVGVWITFNEPLSFCGAGYGGGDAPGAGPAGSGLQDYLCTHHTLLAHAAVYRLYKEHFQDKQKGKIGITLDFSWLEAATTSQEDQKAAETARQFMFGWFAHPIFSSSGDYPAEMKSRVAYVSRKQGFPRSRLPTFTPQQIQRLKGASDFLGLNHYTTYLVNQGSGEIHTQPSFGDDMGVVISQKDEWPRTNSTWLRVVPWGFRKSLNWVKDNYNNPTVLITENGVSQAAGLRDTKRVSYIDAYLRALSDAIYKDGCSVTGYTYWSLLDNYEWMRGFSERFGLFEVNYGSPARTRTARLSSDYYGSVARTGCLPKHYDSFFN